MNMSEVNSTFMSQQDDLMSIKSFNNGNNCKTQSLSKHSLLNNISLKKLNVPTPSMTPSLSSLQIPPI